MSALIRYFLSKGKRVGGYDKTPSALTEELRKEGADIHYEDRVDRIGEAFRSPRETLVVYTPAVPESHTELTYFREHGFEVMKRAQVLGEITRSARGLCVAGTHGKTTTSSMLAHLLKCSHVDCNAFLGGILKPYESNLMLSDKSDLTVIEADEFDRSFHWLTPYMAVITSADPDHLDIYGTAEAYRESFEKFTSLIRPDGCLLIKKGIRVTPRLRDGVREYTYSVTEKADFYAENVRAQAGNITFDFVGPGVVIPDVELGVPVKVNVENGVAAMAIAWLNGVTPEEIRQGMASFAGPRRRFDFHLRTDRVALIDDYAHHPAELRQSILSVKELYAGRKVTGIFQPHLYSRTRDFADDFDGEDFDGEFEFIGLDGSGRFRADSRLNQLPFVGLEQHALVNDIVEFAALHALSEDKIESEIEQQGQYGHCRKDDYAHIFFHGSFVLPAGTEMTV